MASDKEKLPVTSEEEWPGLERAIEEVTLVQHKLHAQGLSQASFFFGVTNVGVTAFVLGRFPAYLWILYAVKAVVLIPLWVVDMAVRYNGALFILDYCWITNIAMTAYMGWLAFDGPVLSEEWRRYAFLWFYASALGPLSWALLALHNGLIFHSIEKTASLFIHFTPTMVAWTLRWFPDDMSETWPSRFPQHSLRMGELGELYLAGLIPYLVWLVLHAMWLLSVGVDCPAKGCATVFDGLYVKSKLDEKFTKMFGCSGIRCHAAIYLVLHAIACSVAFAWAVLCYSSFWLHTIWAAILYLAAAWVGAGYYNYVFTGVYARALGALLPNDVAYNRRRTDAAMEHLNEGTPKSRTQTAPVV